ncbi:hypothetical protein [Streptomyces sp. MST-110588]|uniref:hypothetical protein n=1 Tax=Streptomyces sp. MST-110588 TaxID=2833628 RepID=UPI001F5C935D|nr:hypothetical protein [Streptomyces sp. MST-110588]UNO40169.1 hypothetical protein KGS77_11925 [Streptomyces sp. MST-110588]
MSVRHTTAHQGWKAAVIACGLVLVVAGCGGDGTGGGAPVKKERSSPVGAQRDKPVERPDTSRVLAELKGEDGIVLTINSAKRDSGGFVTVNGQVKNTGSKLFTGGVRWRGDETDVLKHGASIAGATLVDGNGKKRYYVLRDTEGRCLCTTGLGAIAAGKTVPVFMQFPAPPSDVNEIGFQLPTFPQATLEISG